MTRQQGGGGARFTFGGQDPHDIFRAFFGEQGGADLFGGAGQVTPLMKRSTHVTVVLQQQQVQHSILWRSA